MRRYLSFLFLAYALVSGLIALAMLQAHLTFARTMGPVLVGAALSAAGVLAQGLYPKGLSDPGLIGIASASAVGASFIIGNNISGYGTRWATYGAILLALVAGFLILRWSPEWRYTFALVLLAIAILLKHSLGFLWAFGSFEKLTHKNIEVLASYIEIGIIISFFVARKLDRMSKLVQIWAIIAIAFLVGTSVSMTGLITMVGLVIPQLATVLIGKDWRKELSLSIGLGAALFLLIDLVTIDVYDVVAPGILVAVIGLPAAIILRRVNAGG